MGGRPDRSEHMDSTARREAPKEDPMLGPNHHSYHLASQMHDERLRHADRIRQVSRDRHDESKPFSIEAHRRITVARLAAAGLASFALSVALAAGAAAAHPAGGGAITLIR
jgi:hypothetical protein